MEEWAKDKKPVWEKVVASYGGNPEAFDWGTWKFFNWSLGKAWVTIGTVAKARKFGWTRYDDTFDTWVETFHAFENAGILPRQSALGVQDSVKPAKLPNPAANFSVRSKTNGENGGHES